MSIIMMIILVAAGFALLIKGADLLVDGSSAFAMALRVSPIVIGLTIVSFGTSLPELIVNVLAAVQGNSGISYGNVIGSNMVNTLVILGVAAIIRPLQAQRGTVWREIPFSLMAVFALFLMCNDALFAESQNLLTRNDGLLLLLFFIIFIVYTFGIPKIQMDKVPEAKSFKTAKIIFMIIAGFAGLLLGGKLVVENAVKISVHFGISDRIIGLTIVAIGTSLPELVTSVVAAFKNQADIAIGNVVGSNIFNIFFVLGISSTITPLPYDSVQNVDLAFLALASFVLFISVFSGSSHLITRPIGMTFLILYILYMVYLFGGFIQ